MGLEFVVGLVLIAWPGAGQSTASPWLVHGIAAPVTALFAAWLMWSTRHRAAEAERRHRAHVIPFRARTDRPRRLILVAAGLALVPALAHATPSAGPYVYFTDTISLLTGPVFFFDRNLQPGGRRCGSGPCSSTWT
jgi:hypothetical protein